MRFTFTDDQRMLRDTVREVLQRECAPDVVRASWEGRPEPARAVWRTLAETGVIGMMASEPVGGLSMSEVDLLLPLEESGYAAFPGPLVDTALVGIPLLEAAATGAQLERWLAPLLSGDCRLVVAFEDERLVAHAGSADLVILQREGRGYCIARGDLDVEPERSVDRTRELGRLSYDARAEHRMRSDVDLDRVFRLARERATLGTAAQLVGLSRRMLDMSVAYAKDREQFGKSIGAQQAVKHRLANALIQQELARPLVYRAGWALSASTADTDVAVSLAKIYAGRAASFVARQSLQVHGAIGYTTEYDLHMWMKRGWALAAARGDASFHRERVGRQIL
jgi:alkylation response protein AidB-like acyl-CoA dehydrogenase